MDEAEIALLEKAVNKAKFKLTQEAGALHDLIEDRLMADFEQIPAYSEATYKAACAWFELLQQLQKAKEVNG